MFDGDRNGNVSSLCHAIERKAIGLTQVLMAVHYSGIFRIVSKISEDETDHIYEII